MEIMGASLFLSCFRLCVSIFSITIFLGCASNTQMPQDLTGALQPVNTDETIRQMIERQQTTYTYEEVDIAKDTRPIK